MSKALPSKGFSPSWNSQQKNVVRIFNLMAAVDEELSQLDALDRLAHVQRGNPVLSTCL